MTFASKTHTLRLLDVNTRYIIADCRNYIYLLNNSENLLRDKTLVVFRVGLYHLAVIQVTTTTTNIHRVELCISVSDVPGPARHIAGLNPVGWSADAYNSYIVCLPQN